MPKNRAGLAGLFPLNFPLNYPLNRALTVPLLSIALFALASTLGCAAKSADYAAAPQALSADVFAAAPAPQAARSIAPAAKQESGQAFEPAGPAAVPVAGAAGGVRKLVKFASLQLKVAELAAAQAAAENLAASLGGYVAAASASEESVSLSLRVPEADFDRALAGLAPLGALVYSNRSAEDVTLQFFDLEGRLATKRDLMDTFRGYLRRAAEMKDILEVESRLADLQNEIDSLGGEFRRLADRIDYATINLDLVLPAFSTPYAEPGLGERLAEVWKGLGEFLKGLVVATVAVVLYGIPILVLLAAAWWLLFGKVGLALKLFRLVAGARAPKPPKGERPSPSA
jgi:hypothetical protein